MIWSLVKKVKLETSLAIPCENFGLYTDKLSQVLKLEQELKIKSSYQRFGNISSEDLKTASYMGCLQFFSTGSIFAMNS